MHDRTKHGSRHLRWWALGAIAAAAVALLSIGTASAHVDPGTYTGDIEEVSANCGGGTISVTTNADGSAVTTIVVTGLMAQDSEGAPKTLTGTMNFPDGETPIAEDGTFSAYFEVLASEIQLAGTFDDGTLSGGLDTVPGDCGTAAYSAVAAATVAPTALPSTGTGSTSGGSSGAPWALVGAAMALLGLGAGVVFLRRRTA
jgi:hypothetical protein